MQQNKLNKFTNPITKYRKSIVGKPFQDATCGIKKTISFILEEPV